MGGGTGVEGEVTVDSLVYHSPSSTPNRRQYYDIGMDLSNQQCFISPVVVMHD